MSGTHQGHRRLAGRAYHMLVSPKHRRRKSAVHLLCAPSKVLVGDYHSGNLLPDFLSLPLWVAPSHAGSGLALTLALATGTLANKPANVEKVPALWDSSLSAFGTRMSTCKQTLASVLGEERDSWARHPYCQPMASQPSHSG